ncbi:MAG: hypothetical protein HRT89_05560 [Lentisphaeria bacterium]|nr:hypothetical protein [Lentisphaeria bacterium]
MPRKLLIVLILFSALGFGLFKAAKTPKLKLSRIEKIEDKLAWQSLHLISFKKLKKACSIHLLKSTFSTYQIYGKNDKKDSVFIIDKDAQISINGARIATIKQSLHLFFTGDEMHFYVDAKRVHIDLSGFKLFYLTTLLTAPENITHNYPEINMADSFMRTDLFADGNWKSDSQKWALRTAGAGAPDERSSLISAGKGRAVNPFSIRGSGDSLLSYGKSNNLNYRAEARFYFGIPPTSKIRNVHDLPYSFALIQGHLNGPQIKFAWDERIARFVLMEKSGPSTWRIVKTWKNSRPPISSWCKIGLEIKDGYKVTAYIDESPILEFESDRFISGPFHIAASTGLIECDDIKAYQINSEPVEKLSPLYVTSNNFETKTLSGRDEWQYRKWSQGKDIFLKTEKDGFIFINSWDAIPGDIYYESIPYHEKADALKDGLYQIRFLKGATSRNEDSQTELFSIKAKRISDKWVIKDKRFPRIDGKITSVLRISRLKINGNRPAIFLDKWIPMGKPINGFIHLSVGCDSDEPQPEHHRFTSTNIFNELFEEAPSEWVWTEGKFRMAARWACANRWNFMACGGTGTPWMASKKRFWGDQSHEYFMSLRPIMPWDAGDKTFKYNPNTDHNWKVFNENFGWYNKHDLNFAFCTDGVNPMSGYAVIYAGDENGKNYLLRKGKVVAENSLSLMPNTSTEKHGKWSRHHPIHWKWWNFRCSLDGNKIIIRLNDRVLFSYTDTDVLKGGHVGFFTARNGFTVSKINSMATRIDRDPFLMWIDQEKVDSKWVPLIRDGVKIEQETPGIVKVSQRIGGGSMAMRHTFKDINLVRTPIVSFPLSLSQRTSVNLFLWISGKSYVIQINDSALTRTKALLTPEFETGEMFQIPFKTLGKESKYYLGKVKVEKEFKVNLLNLLKKKGIAPPYQLDSITIGNSSEAKFLNFGALQNQRGTGYQIGKVTHE